MSGYAPARTTRSGSPLGHWMAKRGVLLFFLQMPVAAVVLGYGLRLLSLPVACFAVFVSSAAFPAWVSHRTAASNDPSEPVHHLHRHALRALALVTTVTALLTSALLVAGMSFWHFFYDLGAELTAEPSGSGWSLIAGVVVYGLSAICTVTSCLVLRPAHRAVRRAAMVRIPSARWSWCAPTGSPFPTAPSPSRARPPSETRW